LPGSSYLGVGGVLVLAGALVLEEFVFADIEGGSLGVELVSVFGPQPDRTTRLASDRSTIFVFMFLFCRRSIAFSSAHFKSAILVAVS
jgi:hypothetical protein